MDAARAKFKNVEVENLDVGSWVSWKNGDVLFGTNFVPPDIATRWYDELQELDLWFRPMLKIGGRQFQQSRDIIVFGQDHEKIKYSGTVITQNTEYPPIVQEIQSYVESNLGVKFNHCMLNRYADGSVNIGPHSDALNQLVIASLSLGAEREWVMTPRAPRKSAQAKSTDDKEERKWNLPNGSMVVMQGDTQKYWKHSIPKQPKIKEGRISLTFRQLLGQ